MNRLQVIMNPQGPWDTVVKKLTSLVKVLQMVFYRLVYSLLRTKLHSTGKKNIPLSSRNSTLSFVCLVGQGLQTFIWLQLSWNPRGVLRFQVFHYQTSIHSNPMRSICKSTWDWVIHVTRSQTVIIKSSTVPTRVKVSCQKDGRHNPKNTVPR